MWSISRHGSGSRLAPSFCSHDYGVFPHDVTKWWPLIVIAFGVFLLVRHYYQLFKQRKKKYEVLDPNTPIAVSRTSPRRLAPPASRLGFLRSVSYLLLRYTFDVISLGVVIAVVLVLIGVLSSPCRQHACHGEQEVVGTVISGSVHNRMFCTGTKEMVGGVRGMGRRVWPTGAALKCRRRGHTVSRV